MPTAATQMRPARPEGSPPRPPFPPPLCPSPDTPPFLPPPPPRVGHTPAPAVRANALPGNRGGGGSRQIGGKPRHVVGIAEASERDRGAAALDQLLGRGVLKRLRGQRYARNDGVDADIVLCP